MSRKFCKVAISELKPIEAMGFGEEIRNKPYSTAVIVYLH